MARHDGHRVDNRVVSGEAHVQFGDCITTINHHHYETIKPEDAYRKLLTSLTFDRMNERVRNFGTALSSTSCWLPSHPCFTAWTDPSKKQEHHGFLWLKGKPGSGKSTIMKETLNWAKQAWPDQIVLSYFFNARSQSALERSSLGLYRSLVWQLQDLLPVSHGLFMNHFQSKVIYKVVDEQTQIEVEVWRENELQNFLVTVVRELSPPPITIFIDALDEGVDDEIRAMVAFLEFWTGYTMAAMCPLRLCLSSRHYPHISVAKCLSVVVEDQAEHEQDIERYIYQQLAGREQVGMTKVRQQVCDRSAGIFLWVVLVVPMLNKAFDRGRKTKAVLRQLETIPPDLHDIFTQIFFQDTDDLEECVTLLQWVLFAQRPLRPVELYHAVQHCCPPNDDDGIDYEDCSIVTPEQVTRYLLHCSRGLVELTTIGEPVVQFIHETVRGYLLDGRVFEQRRPVLTLQPVSAQDFKADTCHRKLSEVCLDYLLQTFRQAVPIEEVYQYSPFALYAAEYWWQHCQSNPSRCGEREYDLALKLLTGGQGYLLSWVRLYDLDQGESNLSESTDSLASALYYTARIGKHELALGVLALGADVNARLGSYNYTALRAASWEGHTQIVQTLLEKGADDYNDALWAAACEGHTQIVQLLLDKDTDGCNRALRAASRRGHTQIVRLLLSKGADRYDGALWVASREGHTQIVQMLLDKDVGDNSAALEVASREGHTQIVQMLLDKGADDYNAALDQASWEGHTQIVQLLLDKGADGYNGALEAASWGGHTQIVRLLLDRGADDYDGALQTASRGGDTQIVQMLLDKGADDYNGALRAALSEGHMHIVQLMLDRGAFQVSDTGNDDFDIL